MANTICSNSPCPSPEVVQIPGAPGDPGAAGNPGSNGINAYTNTSATLTVPATGSNVTVAVGNNLWMVIGQNVFVSDSTNFANFQVVGIQTSPATVTLKALGYNGDAGASTVIGVGATVVPGGVQGTNGIASIAYNSASTGGSQSLSATPAQALTASLTLVNSVGATYMIFARVRLDYVGATFAANQTATLTIRRTNNTAANLLSTTIETAIVTTQSSGIGELTAIVPYTTVGSGDTIQPFVTISTTPSAGSVNVVEASISAIRMT